MKLYRVTYSGEAYVLADSPEAAQAVIESQVNNATSLGLNLEPSGPILRAREVEDWAWRDTAPYTQRFDPTFADKTIRQILEGE